MALTIIQLILSLFFPILAIRLAKYYFKNDWLSPVVLSYGFGILLANFGLFPINVGLAKLISEASILLAIPLLLYSTDLVGWFRLAKSTILSFVLCVLSGLLCALTFGWLLRDQIENTAFLSGMITGIFTGGIPNMNAIGMALQAPDELLVYLYASDVLIGGAFLIFLTSVAPKIYGSFLKKFEIKELDTDYKTDNNQLNIKNIKEIGLAFGLTLLIIGAAAGVTFLITRKLEQESLIILLLTTFSVIASLSHKVRGLKGAYELGDYLLLVFCVAIGMLANFENIFEKGTSITLFMGLIWLSTVVLHLFLSWLFKIDRDTTIITSTAALYGPPFIGQIANVINNRRLILSGMATGLIGYAIGNYLGIGMANLLQYLI